jgi:peptide/nickel transport system substrate-binding protein
MAARPVLAVLLVLLAAACGRAPATVHIALSTPVLDLEPCSEDHETNLVLGNVYEPLVEYDRDFGLRPCLAESWETPGPNAWVFRLRSGVRFHDGAPLTAADAAASLLRARDHSESLLASHFAPVASVTAPDARTVAIATRSPIADLPHFLTAAGIVPAGREPDGVGTGPYRLVSRTEEAVALSAFDGYWGGRPAMRELRFFLVRPDDPIETLVRNRPLLILRDAARFAELARRGFRVEKRPGMSVAYLGFNLEAPPFDDARVRRAVARAVRAERIVEERLLGNGRVACQVTPVGAFGHHPSLACAPDPAAARAELAATGLPLPVAVTLLTAPKGERTVRLVAADLEAAGFAVTVEARPWPEVVERMLRREAPFYFSGYMSSFGNALPTLETLFASWGSSNTFQYRSPAMDDLLRRAAAAADDTVRLPLLHRAAETAAEDLPLVPLYNAFETYAFTPRLRWEPRADGRILGKELRLQ